MVRRLVALLIAFAIAVALPPIGGAMPAAPTAVAADDCGCANTDQDCGEHGKTGCSGALACAVQCGTAMPMMAGEISTPATLPVAKPHLSRPAPLPASAVTAPPFRPPTSSIPA